ncbi:DUF3726 domain-containing protein [Denitrobaculum tricleocarpae]|uniref:DUF3726 domain-containing protein n=1 Tax=Denitrobaculum tricleocarpae TaxID=2591009 RepID=A0A545TMU9_9PROT|nr:DUF3726 domain-containing protein [Denitrobaculum tricleocarpae]TQV78559.1 DUF3726 domain-containing protein [Denitrobaculum tricleocarpae]
MSDPTIQSPSGPGKDVIGDWRVSLAEIDAMGRKAARGAGFTWGMAEEAGRAARWLAAYRLPGPEALVAVLNEVDAAVPEHAPRIDGDVWHCNAEALCPIASGAALSDRAKTIVQGGSFRLGPVIWPVLVVPFLCRAARDLDCAMTLRGGDFLVHATSEGPVARDWWAVTVPLSRELLVTRIMETPGELRRPGSDAHVLPVELWRRLDHFAQRTYAPATEASRRAGAGAGLIDRD